MKLKELVPGVLVLAVLSSCHHEFDSPSGITSLDVGTVVTADEALQSAPGIVVVFVESDFSSTHDIVGFGWEPGSPSTLDVDYGNDSNIDLTITATVAGDGVVRFQPYDGTPIPFAAATERDRVTITGTTGVATHIVQYVAFSSIDYAGDRVCGSARNGVEVTVRVFDPGLPFPGGVDDWPVADATETWCADFGGLFDIVPGDWGWALTPNGNGHTQLHWAAPPALPVLVDIKPGSGPNPVNCNESGAVISVAILTTDDFDATTVDHTTVTFEGASETHVNGKTGELRRHEEDVDEDGDMDLVLHFRMSDTSLTCSSTVGAVVGETYDGMAIEGSDAVQMIG